jgi:uncharacterized protein YjaZ
MNINIICAFINNTESITKELLIDYFSQNNDILENIYFVPKKVNIADITLKLSDANYIEKINSIVELYKSIDLKKYISNKINDFINDTKQQIDSQEIYVIIGLDTTTIYSTKYKNKDITVIMLESAISFDNLIILLAHEFTHWVRAKYINHDIFETCIGERFITEGIACVYSKERVPYKKDYDYCIVSESTFEWCKNNIEKLDELARHSLYDKTQMATFFYMYAKIDIPVRTGYVYGYLKVLDYLKKNRLTVKDVLTISWQEIL